MMYAYIVRDGMGLSDRQRNVLVSAWAGLAWAARDYLNAGRVQLARSAAEDCRDLIAAFGMRYDFKGHAARAADEAFGLHK